MWISIYAKCPCLHSGSFDPNPRTVRGDRQRFWCRYHCRYQDRPAITDKSSIQSGYACTPIGRIRYRASTDSGAWRITKKSKTVADEVNAFWVNRSFHNYADYALSQEFEVGLNRLLALSKTHHCAIMCAEAVWWRCHRRIVADYLLLRGVEVIHIMDKDKANTAVLSPAAKVHGLKLTYPAGE